MVHILNMKKYSLTITLFIGAVIFQILPSFASYIPSSPIVIPGNPGQLLINNNGALGVVSNGYATSTPSGLNEINIGAYPSYPNPNGMFNTYDESATSPILSASFMGSSTQYVQVFAQDLNPFGSSDFVAADDKGTSTSSDHYIDLGIANSKQTDADHTLIQGYDAYLYNQSSRLLLGTATTSASSSIVLSLGMQSGSPSMTLDQYGHTLFKGSKPGALSGCGTAPSVIGNDNGGTITLGAGLSVTSCSMAFANSFPTLTASSTMSCSVTSNSGLSAANVTSATISSVTFGLSISLGGGKLNYQCGEYISNN